MPRPGPRTTNKYSDRFKATAVRLSELPGVAVQDVAESLYIHPFMLSRWRKQMREGELGPISVAAIAGVLLLRHPVADLCLRTRWGSGDPASRVACGDCNRLAIP
jgi:transposase